MEDILEEFISEAVKSLTASSARVEVSFNGSSFLRIPSPNRDTPLMGTTTLNFMVTARGQSKRKAMLLADKLRDRFTGIRPVSIHPLISVFWCPTVSYVGEAADGFHDVAITLSCTLPYSKETKIC